jgi:hypothetical protein
MVIVILIRIMVLAVMIMMGVAYGDIDQNYDILIVEFSAN